LPPSEDLNGPTDPFAIENIFYQSAVLRPVSPLSLRLLTGAQIVLHKDDRTVLFTSHSQLLGTDENAEPVSNVTLESPSQPAKQLSPRTSTDDGRQIDESDEQSENADDFIRESLEPVSNITLESASH
jgi:hypothetical protein